LERLLLKKALRKASHVIAVSENTKTDIIKKFKITKEKISVIYCAAAEEFKTKLEAAGATVELK